MRSPLPRPVALLAAQGLTFGLLSGFVIIPASGIFLGAYGARALAWVYLGVAVAGGALLPVMTRSVARWPFKQVSTFVVATIAALVTLSWIGLESGLGPWIAFGLEVLFPMTLQFGFVLIGGQAGRLLTVREMKEQFSRIVSGFAIGFFVSGLVAAPLLAVVGETRRLLVGGVLCALVWLALVVRTGAVYSTELSTVDAVPEGRERPSLAALGRHPLVLSLLAYQFLSALGTQLVEYLVYDRAVARFDTVEDLARFTSVFTVVLNLVDILFVTLVAGALIRRFGMRLGLVANPIVVLSLVAVSAVAGVAAGIGGLLVFVGIGAARVTDIAFSDGATRGAINTAYMALPAPDRLAAQAAVEGLGQPAAIGATGVLLLLLQHVFDAGTTAALGVTLVVGVVWSVAGVTTYRRYRATLHQSLSTRTLRAPIPLAAGLSDGVLGADPAVSSSEVAAILTGTEPDHVVVRSLRNCPRSADAELADVLAGHVGHRSRDVGLEVLRTLARVAPVGHATRSSTFEAVVEAETADALAILGSLAPLEGVEGVEGVDHVRRALGDEQLLVRDRVLAAIALVTDVDAVTRAAHWLDSGDDRTVAAAVESLEVMVPSRLRHRCVALVQTSGPAADQLRALVRSSPSVASTTSLSPAEVLDGLLRREPRDAARRWTVECARFCLGGQAFGSGIR